VSPSVGFYFSKKLMSKKILIKRADKMPFSMIANYYSNDIRISWEAFSFLSYFFCQSDWFWISTASLEKHRNWWIRKVRSTMNELINKWYMIRKKSRTQVRKEDNYHIEWKWWFYTMETHYVLFEQLSENEEYMNKATDLEKEYINEIEKLWQCTKDKYNKLRVWNKGKKPKVLKEQLVKKPKVLKEQLVKKETKPIKPAKVSQKPTKKQKEKHWVLKEQDNTSITWKTIHSNSIHTDNNTTKIIETSSQKTSNTSEQDNSSEEIATIEVNGNLVKADDMPSNYRHDITVLCKAIKDIVNWWWLAYDKAEERKYWKLILDAKEFWANAERWSCSRSNLAISVAKYTMENDFWKWPLTGPKAIYLNYVEVVNRWVTKSKSNVPQQRKIKSAF